MPIRPSFIRSRHARFAAGASIALAASGIVLLRAPRHGSAAPGSPTVHHGSTDGPTRAGFDGPGLHGRIAVSQSAVERSGTREVLAELDVTAAADTRPGAVAQPVAMAVVLDVSGSMQGEKLAQAQRSVLELVDHMRSFDRIAFVTYSDSATLVQPLAPLSEARTRLHAVVPAVAIQGGTNIPSGLELGARALAEAPTTFVRRVVLISDGQDGSGQPLPSIVEQVRARASGGVTLSSLGIGADYDERFLSGVADAGRGNYEFLAAGASMTAFLSRELEQATHTSVDRAVALVTLPAGVRLHRALGTEAEGTAGIVRLPIGSLSANDTRHIVLQLDVIAGEPGPLGALATRIEYRTVADDHARTLEAGSLALHVVRSPADADATRDVAVFADAQSATLAANEVDAMNAWSAGDVDRAQRIVHGNLGALAHLQAVAPSPARQAQAAAYASDSATIGSVAAGSESGRAYGLRSRAVNRAAQWHANAF